MKRSILTTVLLGLVLLLASCGGSNSSSIFGDLPQVQRDAVRKIAPIKDSEERKAAYKAFCDTVNAYRSQLIAKTENEESPLRFPVSNKAGIDIADEATVEIRSKSTDMANREDLNVEFVVSIPGESMKPLSDYCIVMLDDGGDPVDVLSAHAMGKGISAIGSFGASHIYGMLPGQPFSNSESDKRALLGGWTVSKLYDKVCKVAVIKKEDRKKYKEEIKKRCEDVFKEAKEEVLGLGIQDLPWDTYKDAITVKF